MSDYARINEKFKEKNAAERLLGYICIQIERESNNYLLNCLIIVYPKKKILVDF